METPNAENAATSMDAMATGGFGIRFAGRLIDAVAGMVAGMVGGVLGMIVIGVLAAMGKVEAGWLQRVQASADGFLLSMAWGLLAGLLYHSVSEGVGGTSIGKLILGYRVVSEDMKPCRFGAAVVRSLAYFVDAFFFGVPAYQSMQNGPHNQRLGDKWAKTIVVKATALPVTARRSGGLVAIGLLCGMTAHAIVMACSMISKAL